MARMLGKDLGGSLRRITNAKLPEGVRWFTWYAYRTRKGRTRDKEKWKREERDREEDHL
jgi:hypothetical protein